MKKGLPKRRDLRKRIAALEQENRELRVLPKAKTITASRYPERYAVAQRYYVDPFTKPEFDTLGLEQYGRREVIRKCAVALAKTILCNAAEITEEKSLDGWRTVQVTVTLVPPFEQNAPEIQEAIDEIKREDK